MRFRSILTAAVASSMLASPAFAHRQWLLPSTSTVASTDEYVTIDAAVSNDLFYPDHVALDPAQVTVWAPDGTQGKVENAAKGRHRGTFDVALNKAGTWKIGMERVGIQGTFKVDGEEWRVGGRGRPMTAPGATGANAQAPGQAPAVGAAPRPPMRMVPTVADIPPNATDVRLTETVTRNFVYLTAGEPSKVALTGKGLEFDPVTHPDELVSDEEGQFRFLIDGKPAAGVKVTIVPGGKKYREAEDAQELATGPDGMLKVKWPVAGWYWLNASAQDARPSDAKAAARRMTFTTTLEVVAP